MKRVSTVLVAMLCAATAIFADAPFRNHRYDAFKVLPVDSAQTVFIGNSITNMNEWWEAFGDHSVVNRGVSGAITDEALENIEAIAVGKPKKVFIMMGTNDLGTAGICTPEHVLQNITLMVERLQKVSPETELYIQSLLPSGHLGSGGTRTPERLQATNAALRAFCEEKDITYIDLWNELQEVATNSNGMSYDKLHLTAKAYKVWCDKVAPYVTGVEDAKSKYSEADQNDGELGGSYGMRTTVFSKLPVDSTDILIIGDEMIHGGEWHELLRSARVKSRGTAWGYPGPSLADMKKMIPVIFHDGATPAQVFLYVGVSNVNKATDVAAEFETYKSIVEQIKFLSPKTKITLMSLQPTSTAATNTGKVVPFNEKMAEYAAAEGDSVYYLDIYSDFVSNDVGNRTYFNGNYLYGKGYAKVAQKMAAQIKALEPDATVSAITDDEAEALYTQFDNRTALGKAIVTASLLPEGDGVGQYTTANLAGVKTQIESAYAALASNDADAIAENAAAFTTAVNEVLPKINQPIYSTVEDTVWYQLSTPNRGSKYLTSNGAGAGVTGVAANNYATSMWKFEARQDGNLNIINRHDNSYLAPTATYNAQITTSAAQPEKGWTLSYSNTPGLFIVSSGTVQLNQTNSEKVYNWSANQSETDRGDTGCQYMVTLVEGEPDEMPDPSLLTLTLSSTQFANGTSTYTYHGSTSSGSWYGKLVTGTNPALTIESTDTTANNIGWSSNQPWLQAGYTYHISLLTGYEIIEYELTTKNALGYTGTFTYTTATEEATSDAQSETAKTVKAKGLATDTITLKIGENTDETKGILITNLIIRYKQVQISGEEEEEEDEVEIMAFTFTRGEQTATVTAPEGLTATIEAKAPLSNATTNDGLWNIGSTLANSTDVLCTMTNTSNATEAEPIAYKLTINGLEANQPIENVTYTSKAFTGGGGYQNYTETRDCNFKLIGNDNVEVGMKANESIMIANGGEKTIAFETNNLTADENGTLVLTLKIWKGTNNNGCFYGLTKIELSKVSVTPDGGEDGNDEEDAPSVKEYTINKTYGDLYHANGSANQSWNATWKSNATPQLQFGCGVNNMNWQGDNVQLMTGTSASATYTLSAPGGYAITEYSFTFANNGHEIGLSLTMDNGTAYTTSTNAQTISAKNIKLSSVAFTLAGNNGKGVVLTDFTVKVKEDKVEGPTISTEDSICWYYITSAAANKNYCNGKVMYYDSEMKKMRFGEKKFSAEYIWSFWQGENGKLAIKNYKGEYFGTAPDGTGGSTTFGVVSEPNYIYNINSAHGFFVIKDDKVEFHAQESGSSIVRWGAEAGGASLWKFDEVDTSHSMAELTSTRVEQGKISTGIGNTDQPIIRSTIRVSGLEGSVKFQGVKGRYTGTDMADVACVKVYFATNARELFIDPQKKMTWREENGEQYGTTLGLAEDGTFMITSDKELAPGDHYLWIVFDVAEEAKEGNLVDAAITSYVIDDQEVAESNGDPQYGATIFLSEGAVLMPMDRGSLYYRIPSITVTKDGKRLVTLTDDRKQHNADLPSHCYLVAQYSEDNGKTWSDPVTVAGTETTGGDYGHGDASIVTNRDNGEIVGIMTSAGTYGHGFFAGTSEQPPRWKTITSRDGGLTWETPVDHTDDLFGANCSNENTKTWKSGFSGSGAALQKRDGTLVSSFVNRQADNSQHFYFFMSKDGGKSWYVSGTSGTSSADEPKTLERNNGDLAISVRASGYNFHNVTSDDGATWKYPSQTRFTTGISGNACDGEYMVWCSTVEGNPWDIALQTLPNSGSRQNVSIALSTDEGETFGTPKTICPRGSAYSATVVLPDGTLGVYYEENGLFGGFTMRFVRFSLDWASDGKYKFTNDAPFYPIKSTNPAGIECLESIDNSGKTTVFYDLQGRQVTNPTKGIYIVNGRKVVIK